jgi:hypothetical protein
MSSTKLKIIQHVLVQAHLTLATTLGDSVVDALHPRHSETAEHLTVGT